jgi:hypothetical protein
MESAVRSRIERQPETFVDASNDVLFGIDPAELAEIQCNAARLRFEQLVSKVPMLSRLAEEQRIDGIGSLADVAPLLVPHSTYKSYPLSVLENSRFDRLTRWLDGFTSLDLSHVDASGVDGIDEWLDLIAAKTDLRLIHSSGTSGKLSFLPRTDQEIGVIGLPQQLRLYEGFRDGTGFIAGYEKFPLVYPSFRYGGMGQQRRIDAYVKYWHKGNGTPVVTLYPGRLSADALSLGGRLAAAEAKGERGRLQISKKLLDRRDEILQQQREAAERIDEFLDNCNKIRGARVYMMGSFAQYYDIAAEGAKRGMTKMFAADSLCVIGGGSKGRDLPDNWKEVVSEFVGGTIKPSYGMSEIMGGAQLCAHGLYHMQPWIALFLLDPKSGTQLPRSGVQKGRLGVFDLLAHTYWGGFLTGDEATVHWGDREQCPCGRRGPAVHPNVRRYTESEGGDDKITCAGAPDAHDNALNYILNQTA